MLYGSWIYGQRKSSCKYFCSSKRVEHLTSVVWILYKILKKSSAVYSHEKSNQELLYQNSILISQECDLKKILKNKVDKSHDELNHNNTKEYALRLHY